MSIKISRESDGRVGVHINAASTAAAIITPVEARLLAIKLLLAAEHFQYPEPR